MDKDHRSMKLKLTPDRIDVLGTVMIYFIEAVADCDALPGYQVMQAVAWRLLENLGVKKLKGEKSIKLQPEQALTLREALLWYRNERAANLAASENATTSDILIEIDQKIA